ncbi:MAG: CDP-alcohol phosphatidyltransferase family protein [Patescibacteria group bacterium]
MKIINEAENCLKRITDAKENFLQNILKSLPLWLNADQLTLVRILCVLPVIFFILNGKLAFALGFFVFGAFLDLIDGPFARVRKKETEIGKILDPFADKLLVAGALMALFYKSPSLLSPLLFWSILVLESILIILTLIGKTMLKQEGFRKRLGANLWGKWKFFLHSISIPLLFLEQSFLAQIILWPSVILAIVSIIGHFTFKAPKQS